MLRELFYSGGRRRRTEAEISMSSSRENDFEKKEIRLKTSKTSFEIFFLDIQKYCVHVCHYSATIIISCTYLLYQYNGFHNNYGRITCITYDNLRPINCERRCLYIRLNVKTVKGMLSLDAVTAQLISIIT